MTFCTASAFSRPLSLFLRFLHALALQMRAGFRAGFLQNLPKTTQKTLDKNARSSYNDFSTLN